MVKRVMISMSARQIMAAVRERVQTPMAALHARAQEDLISLMTDSHVQHVPRDSGEVPVTRHVTATLSRWLIVTLIQDARPVTQDGLVA